VNALLYHGTTDKHLDRILSHGLKPRGKRRKGNWDSYPSHPDFVYLSTAYSPYFAWNATDDNKGEKALVVEVDSRLLAETRLFPDEDFVAQVISKTEGRPLDEVHPKVRDTILYYGDLAQASIEHLGNVAHRGDVPVEAITRYATIDLGKQMDLAWACMDPSISLTNYRICGNKYRSIIAWIFGDRSDFDVGSGMPNEQYLPMIEQLQPGYSDSVRRVWQNRDGIEVVSLSKAI
jgi:hypothetical protein